MLKQLQLLRIGVNLYYLGGLKQLHTPKLLIGYTQYSNVTLRGQKRFHPLYMHLGILTAWAASGVYGELEHCKAILQDVLSELCIVLPVLLGIGRQVEKN